jgi:type IV pilus assembly protein PilM
MRHFLDKNRSNGVVGLDIDGSYLAALQMKDGRVEAAVSTDVEEGVVTDGEVTDPDRLSNALKELFKSAPFSRNVRLGVANQQIVVRQIEMPKIADEKERDAAIRFQTAETVAMPLDETIVDYHIVGEVAGEGAPRERVIVVAARRSMIDSLVQAVRGAGLKPAGIDLNAFAVVRVLAGSANGHEGARAYCHVSAGTNLAVADGSTCLFTRPLSARPRDEHGANALAEELRLSIDFHLSLPGAPPVGEVVLSGPGAEDGSLAESLGSLIDRPVSVAQPLGAGLPPGFPGSEDPFRHTVSAGLAMGDPA